MGKLNIKIMSAAYNSGSGLYTVSMKGEGATDDIMTLTTLGGGTVSSTASRSTTRQSERAIKHYLAPHMAYAQRCSKVVERLRKKLSQKKGDNVDNVSVMAINQQFGGVGGKKIDQRVADFF